jgi:hypothetical protein
MPWVYVWEVKTGERDRVVRLELGVFGRERLSVDGETLSDSYSFKLSRRIPVPLGAGHSAGVEVALERLWPRARFSMDGSSVTPRREPRVPLWGWALSILAVAIAVVPLVVNRQHSLLEASLRGAAGGMTAGVVLYASAAIENALLGFLVSALLAGGVFALSFLRP